MSTLDKLASSLGRRDEVPNQDLAKEIAEKSDTQAIKELAAGLDHKNKDIQSDCIKTLYETGHLAPRLIAPYIDKFISLLHSRNNRLQWGAMQALKYIADIDPEAIYTALPLLAAAAEKGTVITKDSYVAILAKLGSKRKYTENVFTLLNEQLLISAVNQLPMYAEQILPLVSEKNKQRFITTLNLRFADLDQESKRKRIEKVIRKLQGK